MMFRVYSIRPKNDFFYLERRNFSYEKEKSLAPHEEMAIEFSQQNSLPPSLRRIMPSSTDVTKLTIKDWIDALKKWTLDPKDSAPKDSAPKDSAPKDSPKDFPKQKLDSFLKRTLETDSIFNYYLKEVLEKKYNPNDLSKQLPYPTVVNSIKSMQSAFKPESSRKRPKSIEDIEKAAKETSHSWPRIKHFLTDSERSWKAFLRAKKFPTSLEFTKKNACSFRRKKLQNTYMLTLK